MKILVVQDYLRSGGTERQAVLLAQSFATAGHLTTLLTFRPNGPLCPTTAGPNLTVTSLQKRDTCLDWWAPSLTRTTRALAPDVILLMGRMANCYGATLQSALPSCPVICTLRTGKPLPWLFRRSLRRVHHIVANSHAARTLALRSSRLAPTRISTIYNGLVFGPDSPSPSPSAAASQRAPFRANHGATAETLVLLDVAMFRPEKNQIALIEIAHRLPRSLPWQLWLAGNGPTLATCRARATELGLTDRVKFLGWLADPTALYAAADVAVHASRRESLSNFLIEAQAHGLPAVAYDALGVSETFAPNESGYVIPMDDAPAFSHALQRLHDDPQLRREMSARARAFGRTHFAAEAQITAYLDRFTQLRQSPPTP